MQPIIQVKGIGKKYDIRQNQGKYIALRDVLMTIIRSPFKFITRKAKSVAGIGSKEEFWALKDVSFDINPGEVVGIIGRNGAGKSTLLKILTGITPPSAGEIIMRGHVASLLEVGTGFHPELSGRENIFLNGAILGMTRKKIGENFDKIVEFAGIEKFIDTPVKYYSSGMYVRLAFSVAAHLEPDILLVDEVLAVGDADFQKKCLGKMEEVTSTDGRTILFVSHNLSAIQRLCPKTILISKGKVEMFGKTEDVIERYLAGTEVARTEIDWKNGKEPQDETVKLFSARLVQENGSTLKQAHANQKIGVEMSYEILKEGSTPLPNIHIYTSKGENAFVSVADFSEETVKSGKYTSTAWIPANLMNEGSYTVGVAISTISPLKIHLHVPEALSFEVVEDIQNSKKFDFNQRLPGVVRPRLSWNTKKI